MTQISRILGNPENHQINQDLRKLCKEAIYFTQQVGYFSDLTP